MLIIALVMSMGITAAFADNAEPGEFTKGEFSQTVETTIEATNLTAGDSIGYIQLVEWDTATSDWKLTTTGESCGVTLAELLNGITEAEATTIANAVSGNGTAMGVSGTTATATVAPGLYFLRAVPATDNKDTVYNPAFVSADYYAGGNSVDLSTAIGSSAVLKKSSVPFDKDVVGSDKFIDTKPGDIIPYQITATIPSYGTSFTNPVFTITDTFSTGLALKIDDTHKFTVAYGANSTEEDVTDVVDITAEDGGSSFTVAFDKKYLTGLKGNTTDVVITYFGEVTTDALENVTYMDNKAKLTFSNKPDSNVDKEDITRHYTFSIDASLNGGNHGSQKTRELIKIGVDDNGQTTAIGTLDTETGEIDFSGWYDMSGHKLSGKPTKKGMYINNGKKVVIKN